MRTTELFASDGRLIGRMHHNSDFSGKVEIHTQEEAHTFDISSDRQTVAASGRVVLAIYEAVKRLDTEGLL